MSPSWSYFSRCPAEPAPPAPRPVRSMAFDIACPACKGTLIYVTPGKPDGIQSQAIVRCPACKRDYIVRARIEDR